MVVFHSFTLLEQWAASINVTDAEDRKSGKASIYQNRQHICQCYHIKLISLAWSTISCPARKKHEGRESFSSLTITSASAGFLHGELALLDWQVMGDELNGKSLFSKFKINLNYPWNPHHSFSKWKCDWEGECLFLNYVIDMAYYWYFPLWSKVKFPLLWLPP